MKSAPPKRTAPKLTDAEIELVRSLVIYEDADILAFNKPSGLSSQGGRGQANTLDELLWAFSRHGKARPRLIHRLDRDTSGVILTAKTKTAAGFLGKAMMARKFTKVYRAIVAPGPPDPRDGTISTPLRRDEQGREAFMRPCAPDHPDAEEAVTRYRTVSQGPVAALMEARPRTGRMHQIRVHLASIGRPIVGDARYGGALVIAGQPAPRLLLHARELIFPHPGGGEKRIEAEVPSDMAALMATLELD